MSIDWAAFVPQQRPVAQRRLFPVAQWPADGQGVMAGVVPHEFSFVVDGATPQPEPARVYVQLNGRPLPDGQLLAAAGGRWSATFAVRDDLQASYQFQITGRDGSVSIAVDPANPISYANGIRGRSSVLWMPGVGERSWGNAFGRIGEQPKVSWVRLAGSGPLCGVADIGRVTHGSPVLILFDGECHFGEIGTGGVLSEAVAAGVLPGLSVIGVHNEGRRTTELGVPAGLVEGLGPVVTSLADRLGRRSGRIVVSGSSFGGLSALFLAARHPEHIDAVIAQSVSTWRFERRELAQLAKPLRHTAVRLSAGRYEELMVDAAARLANDLGVDDLRMRAVSGGHDWAWWVPELVTDLAEILSG